MLKPAGVWDAEAQAAFGEMKAVDAPPLVLASVESGRGEPVEMGGSDELGLCLTIMVMEELQGVFGMPRSDIHGTRYSSIEISWDAWVHGLLESRV
jgi:hypothetical protein